MSANPIKIAAKLYETRDTMRSLLGTEYISVVSAFIHPLQAEMQRTGKSVLSACVSLAGGMPNENARLVLVACAVEMAEPDPAFPLPFSPTPMISKQDSEQPGELDATKPAPERKKERRSVECILTQQERNEHSHTLAESIQQLAQLEDRKKSIVKQLDAEIAEKKAVINKESGIVKDGKEYRDILCEWHLDRPVKGKKQLIRTDAAFTGPGIVATYDMSGEDTQSLIAFEKGGQS